MRGSRAVIGMQIHSLHYLETEQGFFVADLDQCRLLEISPLIRDILQRCSHHTKDELRNDLIPPYTEEEFAEVLNALEEIASEGLLFASPAGTVRSIPEKQRSRFFILQHRDLWFLDIENLSTGTNISLYHQICALAKSADIHIAGSQFEELSEGIFIKHPASLMAEYIKKVGRRRILCNRFVLLVVSRS